jgi:hypothetical protein
LISRIGAHPGRRCRRRPARNSQPTLVRCWRLDRADIDVRKHDCSHNGSRDGMNVLCDVYSADIGHMRKQKDTPAGG